jgi:hypothetical protein
VGLGLELGLEFALLTQLLPALVSVCIPLGGRGAFASLPSARTVPRVRRTCRCLH